MYFFEIIYETTYKINNNISTHQGYLFLMWKFSDGVSNILVIVNKQWLVFRIRKVQGWESCHYKINFHN